MFYIVLCILSAFICEAVVELVSKSVFFSFLRTYLLNSTNRVKHFFGEAIKCPYCCSVWVSFILTLVLFVFVTPVLTSVVVIDFVLFLLVVHRLSNYVHDFSDRYISKDYLPSKKE